MPTVAPSGVLFGLASALSFGVGDFVGGVASRRSSGLAVAALGQLVGTLLLAVLLIVLRPDLPSAGSLAIGAAAGISGAIGVASLYAAMATGAMGLVAAVSGAGAVTVPLLIGIFLLQQPIHPWQAVGVACAAAAVVAAGGASGGGTGGLAAALSGIYPLFTMLMARAVLRERLPRLGLAGVGLALVAIVLISAG